jgi:hypothetical protein
MADRLTTAMGRLRDRQAVRVGVPAVYARGAVSVPVVAVIAADAVQLTQPGQPAVRLGERDRDWVIDAATLAAVGLFPPKAGDTVTAGGVEFTVGPRAADPLRAIWEWGEAERVTVRVRSSQRGPVFVALPVDWDDGSAVLWDDGSAVLWG